VPLTFQGKPLGIIEHHGAGDAAADEGGAARCSTSLVSRSALQWNGRGGEEETMRARADERARLAREIHDTLAQGWPRWTLLIGPHAERRRSRRA